MRAVQNKGHHQFDGLVNFGLVCRCSSDTRAHRRCCRGRSRGSPSSSPCLGARLSARHGAGIRARLLDVSLVRRLLGRRCKQRLLPRLRAHGQLDARLCRLDRTHVVHALPLAHRPSDADPAVRHDWPAAVSWKDLGASELEKGARRLNRARVFERVGALDGRGCHLAARRGKAQCVQALRRAQRRRADAKCCDRLARARRGNRRARGAETSVPVMSSRVGRSKAVSMSSVDELAAARPGSGNTRLSSGSQLPVCATTSASQAWPQSSSPPRNGQTTSVALVEA
eukprot:scaffold31817_cov83-Phaeocystis_antarctica.AAC.4